MSEPQELQRLEYQIDILRQSLRTKIAERDRLDTAIEHVQGRLEYALHAKFLLFRSGVCS